MKKQTTPSSDPLIQDQPNANQRPSQQQPPPQQQAQRRRQIMLQQARRPPQQQAQRQAQIMLRRRQIMLRQLTSQRLARQAQRQSQQPPPPPQQQAQRRRQMMQRQQLLQHQRQLGRGMDKLLNEAKGLKVGRTRHIEQHVSFLGNYRRKNTTSNSSKEAQSDQKFVDSIRKRQREYRASAEKLKNRLDQQVKATVATYRSEVGALPTTGSQPIDQDRRNMQRKFLREQQGFDNREEANANVLKQMFAAPQASTNIPGPSSTTTPKLKKRKREKTEASSATSGASASTSAPSSSTTGHKRKRQELKATPATPAVVDKPKSGDAPEPSAKRRRVAATGTQAQRQGPTTRSMKKKLDKIFSGGGGPALFSAPQIPQAQPAAKAKERNHEDSSSPRK